MIHLPASVRVYLCLTPTDMRRSFDGLHALVCDHLQLDAFAGHLYIFSNRRKRQAQSSLLGCVQSCAEDGSRPPGIGFQELASNHPEPLRSKGVVVNVRGKGVRKRTSR